MASSREAVQNQFRIQRARTKFRYTDGIGGHHKEVSGEKWCK